MIQVDEVISCSPNIPGQKNDVFSFKKKSTSQRLEDD
jgi:hypothetical protein